MKTLIITILSCIVIFYSGLSIGIQEGKKMKTYEVQTEIANRYFEKIGNPKTQEEQCKFDYVVHNDSTECYTK